MERDRAGRLQEQERNMNWKPFPIYWKPSVRLFQITREFLNDFKMFMVGDVGLEPTTR